MPKPTTHFVCSECGYDSVKWYGKCPSCNNWNTLQEFNAEPKAAKQNRRATVVTKSLSIDEIETTPDVCMDTGFAELNRVLGGGIYEGSLILAGGEPGIGKSTLFLQLMSSLANRGKNVLYISGEESLKQIKLRANRLGVAGANLHVLSQTEVNAILNHVENEQYAVAVVDSIQTLYDSGVSSPAGSVTQVRECAAKLNAFAKEKGCAVILIGHVTKEGSIAGPRVLEHMVDTVLYFEGSGGNRILRAHKNRFGSTNEIGVFEMRSDGMAEVTDFSGLFISEYNENTVGSGVFCALEGSRPVLLEVQALVSKTSFNLPRRVSTGVDYNRCLLIAAVLEKKTGLKLYEQDIYLNIAGGLKLSEPAGDLAIALCILSSHKNISLGKCVILGELGLTGEIRGVSAAQRRVDECLNMGFNKIILPASNKVTGAEVIGVHNIWQVMELFLG